MKLDFILSHADSEMQQVNLGVDLTSVDGSTEAGITELLQPARGNAQVNKWDDKLLFSYEDGTKATPPAPCDAALLLVTHPSVT